MKKITIVIAEDQLMLATTLASLLNLDSGTTYGDLSDAQIS